MNDKEKINKIEGIEDEFQDLALKLSKVDYSINSDEKNVYDKVLKNIEKSDSMKKLNMIKKCSIAAAVVIASGVLVMQNTSAKESVRDFINKVSLGSITVYQENTEGKNLDDYRVLYDENGNEVSTETIEKGGVFYSKNGDEIKIQAKDDVKVDKLVVTDTAKINNYTSFKVKLPSYLPDGYKFKQAEFYKDDNGEVKATKYCDLIFVNEETNEKFFMQEREDCDETKAEMSTDGKVERIQINGVDAALSDNRNIDWVKDGTIYGLMGKKLSRSEVIKVAESID